jgi:hypothetical protein
MTTPTKTRGPSTRRTKSWKDRSATASPLTAGEVVLQALCAETRALRKAKRKVCGRSRAGWTAAGGWRPASG